MLGLSRSTSGPKEISRDRWESQGDQERAAVPDGRVLDANKCKAAASAASVQPATSARVLKLKAQRALSQQQVRHAGLAVRGQLAACGERSAG